MNRRETFRSPLADIREATLWIQRHAVDVQIVDESSGGICVSCREAPQLVPGAEIQLETDDGDWLRLEVVRVQNCEGTFRIGLKRTNLDINKLRRRNPSGSVSPLILLIGITLGLYGGFALSNDALRHQLASIPGVSKFLHR
ncbi:MAG: PilZ domain-containing protein [Planctomycetaceae bacterium]|nr:PilZ domain-containing protein [Planctomycetaceae bacterium]